MQHTLKKLFLQPYDPRTPPSPVTKTVNALLVFALLFAMFAWMFSTTEYNFDWVSVWEYRGKFIDGFFTTIKVSFFSLILSIMVGGFFAYAQKSSLIALRYFSYIYVETIRGTPLLVQILIFFYVFATSLGFEDRLLVGICIMAIFSGAYMTEIIRAGVESIGKDQHEASLALNFTNYQKYRFIILPQAIKRILPPMTGQFANLIKDSSLLSIIAIREFTMNAQEINAFTFSTLEAYIPLAIGYFILTYPISLLTKSLEKHYRFH